jgi:hypothetical protein
MITGIDVNEAENFISIYDKGEVKTIWKLCSLDYKTFTRVGKMSEAGQAEEALAEAVKNGLKGVEHYTKEFSFSDDFLKTIPPMVFVELGKKIMQLSVLTEGEIKNS